ncbi:MAG: polyprenyl diphosphate synthase, partial [Pseudomonadota bacterium]
MIMDGNGRWAEARGLPRALGHRAGVDAVRRTIRATVALGIPYLTLYSFSTENWARPAREVEDLMVLMKRFLLRDLAELHQNGIRVRMIGCRHGVDPELLSLIDRAVSLTEANTTLTLNIAFNYGARDEITNAVREIAERVASGEIAASEIDHGTVAQALDTADIPDPDLLIRTSG